MAKRKVHNERGAGRKPSPKDKLRTQLHFGMRKPVYDFLLTIYTRKELQAKMELYAEKLFEIESLKALANSLEQKITEKMLEE